MRESIITADLRAWLIAHRKLVIGWVDQLEDIADKIDNEYFCMMEELEARCAELQNAHKERLDGMIALPVGADGLAVRIGDTIRHKDSDIFFAVTDMTYADCFTDGEHWSVGGRDEEQHPHRIKANMCTHQPIAIEGLLSDLIKRANEIDESCKSFDMTCADAKNALNMLLKEYASRLRLADE